LKRDHRTIENRPGGTHPGAEHGAMRGSLMLGMVPGMFDRLCLRQSADGQDTEHQEDRYELEDFVVHQTTTQCDFPEC
jgi:hypothetical protein